MAENAPGPNEQELLAIYDRLDALVTNIEVNLMGKYGGPIDQARRLQEAKNLRAEVISKMGYQPKSSLDNEIEELKGKIGDGRADDYDYSGDQIFIGSRGGLYRYNSNGRKSYDV